jgi:hypothetical protein
LHTYKSFLEQVATRRERVIGTLGDLKPPVTHAELSTLLAISVHGLSNALSWRNLSLSSTSVFIIALAPGLFLSPVPAGLFRPARKCFSADKKSEVGRAIGEQSQAESRSVVPEANCVK